MSDRNRPAVCAQSAKKGRPSLCRNCQCTKGADKILPWLALDNSKSTDGSRPTDDEHPSRRARAASLATLKQAFSESQSSAMAGTAPDATSTLGSAFNLNGVGATDAALLSLLGTAPQTCGAGAQPGGRVP